MLPMLLQRGVGARALKKKKKRKKLALRRRAARGKGEEAQEPSRRSTEGRKSTCNASAVTSLAR